MIQIKIIKCESDYTEALGRLSSLMDAVPGSPEEDDLELLSLVIEKYEEEHFPIDLPDPVEAIKFRMEQQGLTRRDLEQIIGTRTRIAEVLNRKRGLSIGMIRRLHERLGIPAEVLIRPSRKDAARSGRIGA